VLGLRYSRPEERHTQWREFDLGYSLTQDELQTQPLQAIG
jgi:hypothetical protein